MREAGSVFRDRYELKRMLGEGGMAEVWEANDLQRGRAVALKVAFDTSKEAQRRFRRECILSDILGENSHFVRATDYDKADPTWMVLDLVRGHRTLRKAQVDATQLLKFVSDAANALDFAHSKGIVHRDVKPSNILIDEFGNVFVTDLGLASAPSLSDSEWDIEKLTRTGSVFGTFPYMAPEQLEDPRMATAAADVYSLAASLYECLSGQPPISLNESRGPRIISDLMGRFDRIREGNAYIAKLSDLDGGLPEELSESVAAALHMDPERRPSMRDFASVLQRISDFGTAHGWAEPGFDGQPEDEAISVLESLWQEEAVPTAPSTTQNPLGLWPWQLEAVSDWEAAGKTGFVEAVTGSGKSLVAYEAIRRHLEADPNNNAIVVVPRQLILHQWWGSHSDPAERKGLAKFLPQFPAGRSFAGKKDGLSANTRIVVTMDTKSSMGHLAQNSGRRLGPHTLLVADECHHYAGVTLRKDRFGNEKIQPNPTSERVANLPCRYRLGLSATVEGYERMEESMHGARVHQLPLGVAMDRKIVAPFKVAFVRCGFGNEDDEARHEEHHQKAVSAARKLRARLGASAATSAGFWAAVGELAAGGDKLANAYVKNWQEARKIRAKAEGKFLALKALAPAMRAAKRSLVFTNLREAEERAAAELSEAGLKVAYIDGSGQAVVGERGSAGRPTIFKRFEARTHIPGRVEVIVSPMVLDEGVDVPEAVMGVVLMGAQGRRQMIQRLGRILRKKEGKVAKFVVLCVRGTPEDPERDQGSVGYQDFIDEVLDVRGEDGSELLERGRSWEIFDEAEMDRCIRWLAKAESIKARGHGDTTDRGAPEPNDVQAWKLRQGRKKWPGLDDTEIADLIRDGHSLAGPEPSTVAGARDVLEHPNWSAAWEVQELLPRSSSWKLRQGRKKWPGLSDTEIADLIRDGHSLAGPEPSTVAGARDVLEHPNWSAAWAVQTLLPRSSSFRSQLAKLADRGLIVDPEWKGDRALFVRWPNGQRGQLFYLYGKGPWVDVLHADESLYERRFGHMVRRYDSGEDVVCFTWDNIDLAVSLIETILAHPERGTQRRGPAPSKKQPKDLPVWRGNVSSTDLVWLHSGQSGRAVKDKFRDVLCDLVDIVTDALPTRSPVWYEKLHTGGGKRTRVVHFTRKLEDSTRIEAHAGGGRRGVEIEVWNDAVDGGARKKLMLDVAGEAVLLRSQLRFLVR